MRNFLKWMKQQVIEATQLKRGCFIYRPVLNAGALTGWAVKNNVGGEYARDLHVTLMYSTVDVRGHRDFKLQKNEMAIDPVAYAPYLQSLGPLGAEVLRFDNGALFDRWREFIGFGAVWTFPTFIPHVTITYKDPHDIERYHWKNIVPSPNFPLHLGAEQAEDLK